MDIALESISSGQRGRFNGPPNPRSAPAMGNPRGPPQPSYNQNYEDNQYQQQPRNNNPRFPSPNYPPPNNYRGPAQRQNFREEQQQPPAHSHHNSHPAQFQQQEFSQPRGGPPRFPPPPQRQPRQNQYEEYQEPDRGRSMHNQYQQRSYEQNEQPRFDRRQQHNRDDGGDFKERHEEMGRGQRQNGNPRFRGNQPNERPGYGQQPDRSYPPQNERQFQNRNEQRAPYNSQRNDQRTDQFEGERGRGRGRGAERGRGRGRGRGREISRVIQESEYHNLPPINKKPQQPKPQEQAEQSASQSGSEEMSQEIDESKSASNESQQSAAQESEMEERSRSQSGRSIQQNSNPSGQEEEASQAIRSQSPAPAKRGRESQSQSENSLKLQQINTMCSKDEFNERLQTFNTNNNNRQGNMMRLDTGRSFAIFEINKKTGEPDYALALKRYRRSTNRSEDDEEKDEETDLPRSTAGLMMAITHIHKEIIDADNVKEKYLAFPLPPGQNRIEFLHIFDFLWNRMREMIKDVSRLDMKDRSKMEIVTMCEQMLRFFIIATREGKLPHNCRLQFDPKLNLESITKILTQLLQIYEETHMKLNKDGSPSIYVSPNEPEIIGYAIIISNDIQKTLNEKLRIRLNGQGLDHPLLASKEIQNALTIKKALKNRDYETFYKIMEDESTDYVLSCLLMHHLPIVRRQALRTFTRACQGDSMTKLKKVQEETFRHAMRFKAKQHREFKQFLSQIGATLSTENGESFVLLGQIEDNFHQNHLASSYIFDSDKLQRSRYNMKPCTKRLSNPDLLSREELTKRSWFSGNYAQLARRYYHPSAEEEDQDLSEEQEITQRPAAVEKQQKKESLPVPLAEKIASPVPQADGNKINFLLMKRKQLERNKFLKNLETLIQNLIKNSDIHSQHKRKKGLQTMLELADFSRLLMLQSAFARMTEYVNAKKIAEQALRQLEKFKKIKQEFESIYNRNTFQFGRREKPENVKMSELLSFGRQRKEVNLLKKLFSIHKESYSIGKRRLRTLYIFISDPKKSFSEFQKAFLVNFYSYLSLGSKRNDAQSHINIQRLLEASSENYLEFQKSMISPEEEEGIVILDYSFTLFNYRMGSNCDIPFLSGYDGVVFLDLWKSVSAFFSLIKDYQQSRKRIFRSDNKEAPPSTQRYMILHIGSTEGNWLSGNIQDYHKETLKKDLQCQNSWQRLESECIRISPCLKITMVGFLSSILRQPARDHPELAVYSLAGLIDQVERNLECISAEDLNQDINSLQFLELYFNQNLDCLRRTVMNTAANFEDFDWKEILQEAIYIKPGPKKYLTFDTPPETIYHDERLNLNNELFKKFMVSLELLSSLKLSLSSAYAARMGGLQNNGLYVLSQLAEGYLQGLCKEDVEEYFSCLVAYVVESNCHMQLTEKVSGDCKNLFLFLLSKVKQKLKFCNIILPRGFEFKISKANLMKKENKVERLLQRSTISKKSELKNRGEFVYSRAQLLNSLLKKIQEAQDEEDQVVEVIGTGKKAVKTQ